MKFTKNLYLNAILDGTLVGAVIAFFTVMGCCLGSIVFSSSAVKAMSVAMYAAITVFFVVTYLGIIKENSGRRWLSAISLGAFATTAFAIGGLLISVIANSSGWAHC